jgi:hypothetical protein
MTTETVIPTALVFAGAVLLASSPALSQTFTLPNDDSGCPSSCRSISWKTGSDIWNGGTLPNYTSVTCSPLHEDGATDDTNNINACIDAAAAGTAPFDSCYPNCAVYLPAGNIYVNGLVALQTGVVVRGAKPEGNVVGATWLPATDAASTTIVLGANGQLTNADFDDSANLTPGITYATFQSTYTLSGSPQKGATSLTTSSGTVAVGSYIDVYGNDDPSLIDVTGTDGTCNWCGNNTGWYVQDQIVQVTNITTGSGGPGSTVTTSPPLYYTPYTAAVTVQGQAEPAGAKYNVITPTTTSAGYEDLRVDGSKNDVAANSLVLFQGCFDCWANSLDVYDTGSDSGSAHIEMDWSYGDEVRNSYLHDQRSGASGAGYGVYFQFANSDHKIENNVIRHTRHWIVFQGGGSGVAVLYNYADDQYTDDTTYLGSGRTSHGAHPFFDLFEGNVVSHLAADDFWGTSSHDVFWRNWIWGDETENWAGAQSPTGTPAEGFDAVDLYQSQSYYSFVGNVLGTPPVSSIPTGANDACQVTSSIAGHAGWSNGTLSLDCATNNCGYEAPAGPGVYSYGDSGLGSAAQSDSTVIRNANYDYLTGGVAYWDQGAANNSIAASLYYSSKPSFFGSCRWPVAGYDQSPAYALNPAEATYLGANVTGSLGASSGTSGGASGGGSTSTSGAASASTSGGVSGSTAGGGTSAGSTSSSAGGTSGGSATTPHGSTGGTATAGTTSDGGHPSAVSGGCGCASTKDGLSALAPLALLLARRRKSRG